MIEQMSLVTRIVEDQDEAVEFYTESVGFEIRRDAPAPTGRFVTVAPPGDEAVELVLTPPEFLDGENAEERAELVGRDWGLVYTVDDCQATYEALVENGVDFRSEPEEEPWGIQAVFTDPSGNETVIQEPAAPAEF